MIRTYKTGITFIEKSNHKTRTEAEGFCEKFWLNIDGYDYLFKANIGKNIGDYGSYISYGEVFFSYLAERVGFSSVNSSFCIAQTDNEILDGCLVQSFIDKDVLEEIAVEDVITNYLYQPNNLLGKNALDSKNYVYEQVFTSIEMMQKVLSSLEKEIKVDKESYYRLYEMCLIDYLVVQTDRNAYNMKLLVKQDKNGERYLTLAPTYDNGYIFALNKDKEEIENINSIVKEDLSTGLPYNFLNKLSPLFNVSNYEDMNTHDYMNRLTHDLALALTKSERLYNIFEKMSELNIREEIENFENITNYHLPNEYKEFIELAYNYRVKTLDQELNKVISENFTL